MRDLAKDKENKWKNKALSRAAENRALRKRLLEVAQSRQHWKQKYKQLRTHHQQLVVQRPKAHHYPVLLIWLGLYVYNNCQCSLRSCGTMIAGCAMALALKCRQPCAATIRNWVVKYGYDCYQQAAVEPASRWAIILDESVAIGQERLLLVLGLNLDQWCFTRALTHTDVQVLYLGIAASWKANSIGQVLHNIAQERTVAYCVSDKGNNLMGAIRHIGWRHIPDCSHEWAKELEKLYSGCADFQYLMQQLALLRKQWVLSKQAHLMPPPLRSKARFQNLFPLLAWIEKLQAHQPAIPPEARPQLSFLAHQQGLIAELQLLHRVIKQMGALLKAKGMNRETRQACECLLAACQQGRPLDFREKVLSLWRVYEHGLGPAETLLISSDVIESYFGKYKLKLKQNGMQAITETVLTMAAWSTNITQESVEKALASTRMRTIYEWKKQNTTPSLLQKRRKFFSKNCTKKQPPV